jgi:uncharacterized protein YbcV (DUF1398 family)
MSRAIENLQAAQQRAVSIRPKVGGFPVLAEVLRQAGVHRNEWFLPAAESLYLTDDGPVVQQGTPLATGLVDMPAFDEAAVIAAIRTDQAGESTFPEFLDAAWRAGVLRYVADFDARTVTYFGNDRKNYVESYLAVEIEPAS